MFPENARATSMGLVDAFFRSVGASEAFSKARQSKKRPCKRLVAGTVRNGCSSQVVALQPFLAADLLSNLGTALTAAVLGACWHMPEIA